MGSVFLCGFMGCGKTTVGKLLAKKTGRSFVDLDVNDKEIKAFLHGEEIPISSETKGYTAVCVNGMTTGFGKASNGKLKNKYPKGLRTLK